ncbi:MAG: helix-hairpin-helix domain-containing protein, partial [Phycisphaerales bacterium]|nr:helix-hairpin-helix domain-containing protein [Phycisphaerales bacterium]
MEGVAITRSGVTIFGVLLLIVISTLVATTVLGAAGAERGVAEVGIRRVQSRALAWSGVQAVMSELLDQREQILRGEAPVVTEEWALFEGPDGSEGVVRLLDLDPDGEARLVSESAKLDVNRATAEMLANLDLVDEALAASIVEARGSGRFESLGDLLEIEGVTPAMLYGVDDQPRLADVLTVYGADPNVQAGLDNATHAGTKRINLNMPWSDRLGRAIAQRLDQQTADGVRQIMENGTTFATDGDVVRVLRFFDVDVEEWVTPFDIFTTSDDAYRFGRVDLSMASAEVLACIPGITPDIAASIVAARDGLDPEERRTVCWPVLEELIEKESFEQAVDWLTTRSMQWRVRLECGIDRGGNLQPPEVESDQFGIATVLSAEEGLEDRIVV